jgi:hypothetical protein
LNPPWAGAQRHQDQVDKPKSHTILFIAGAKIHQNAERSTIVLNFTRLTENG